ncbi:MFS transporter [Metapseudomonas resinovorans]|uniref:Putative major facilitator superfamily transporter n=1 Tax=Metapseudomonas resinovorans NBRC 106553 TaxID=1245471 RepID=S6AJM4_METRE|nr:MFS transporter [Pseudomonas resinovorans]BAN48720.1 putative major facilitator superfamily transporter [Pseudomonas resinovorans NBRC 106553]
MSDAIQPFPAATAASPLTMKRLYGKLVWRLMPFLMLAFIINAIDRLNLSFAKLRMAEDIALSDAAYGIGAGIFYLGYILFEVPSNLYMQRVGARATLTRIMILWGLITVATAFVTTPSQLIVARFLLGVAEAGFFPGLILYLTYWFPAAMRGRITASFFMAAMVAGMICGPLSGAIMSHLHGWMGLRDWQVLFVLTGLPAVVLGIIGRYWLTDRPEQATWLDDDEKQQIQQVLAQETVATQAHQGLRGALRDPLLYVAGLVCFCIYSAANTVSYWLPTLVRGFGMEDLKQIGLVTALPFLGGLCAMYLLGRSSDRHMERRWHLGLTMLVAASCFFLLDLVQGQLVASVLVTTLGAAAALSAMPLFWTVPPALLSRSGAAGGIAIISSIGNLAGVLSQSAVGAVKTATGSLYLALDLIALLLVIGSLLLLIGIPARRLAAARPAEGT